MLYIVDFRFATNGLFIVASSRGVGKGLLPVAVIGEADTLFGTIRRPEHDLSSQGQEN